MTGAKAIQTAIEKPLAAFRQGLFFERLTRERVNYKRILELDRANDGVMGCNHGLCADVSDGAGAHKLGGF